MKRFLSLFSEDGGIHFIIYYCFDANLNIQKNISFFFKITVTELSLEESEKDLEKANRFLLQITLNGQDSWEVND